MKYRIKCEYMHGDADHYESRDIIFDDNGNTDSIEYIRKILKEYKEDSRYDESSIHFTQFDDDDLYMFFEEILVLDIPSGKNWYAQLKDYSIDEIQKKPKVAKPKFGPEFNDTVKATLKQYSEFILSKINEDEFSDEYIEGVNKTFKDLLKAVNK